MLKFLFYNKRDFIDMTDKDIDISERIMGLFGLDSGPTKNSEDITNKSKQIKLERDVCAILSIPVYLDELHKGNYEMWIKNPKPSYEQTLEVLQHVRQIANTRLRERHRRGEIPSAKNYKEYGELINLALNKAHGYAEYWGMRAPNLGTMKKLYLPYEKAKDK